jgi:2-polyprenyl-6-methoxyphenol hydroxylase-like FAD-dependent oxidoreductase
MVDRNLLRKLLMKNLDIQYNKHLTTYESDGESVNAIFKDGSTAHGTLLVGADGSNSRVRANLLDGFVPTPSRAIMLNGSVKLSRTEWEPIVQHGSGGLLFGEVSSRCMTHNQDTTTSYDVNLRRIWIVF